MARDPRRWLRPDLWGWFEPIWDGRNYPKRPRCAVCAKAGQTVVVGPWDGPEDDWDWDPQGAVPYDTLIPLCTRCGNDLVELLTGGSGDPDYPWELIPMTLAVPQGLHLLRERRDRRRRR